MESSTTGPAQPYLPPWAAHGVVANTNYPGNSDFTTHSTVRLGSAGSSCLSQPCSLWLPRSDCDPVPNDDDPSVFKLARWQRRNNSHPISTPTRIAVGIATPRPSLALVLMPPAGPGSLVPVDAARVPELHAVVVVVIDGGDIGTAEPLLAPMTGATAETTLRILK